MATEDIYDIIIVGGGPAGITAGIYAMRAAMKTVLIEKGIGGGQVVNTDSVENYPGFQNITGFDLARKFLEHVQSYQIEMVQQEVTAIEPGEPYHLVRLADGSELKGYAVAMGLGGSPRKLEVPGEADYYGKGVSYCATCDGFFFRNQTVVVVGGGDTALEEALYLAKITNKVYLVHRRDEFRGSRILQQRVAEQDTIEVVWNSVVTEIKGNEQGVKWVRLKDTQTGEQRDLETDGVFIFVGFVPNSQLVPAGVEKDSQGYVITDDQCETAVKGIYAMGDLRKRLARQIVIAAADGCLAALAASQYVESKKGQ